MGHRLAFSGATVSSYNNRGSHTEISKMKWWILAAILTLAPVAAIAGTKWYFLDDISETCTNAASINSFPAMRNPATMINWLRRQKGYLGYRVFHQANGRQVTIYMRGGLFYNYYYFSSKAICDEYAPILRSLSHIPNQPN